jgi:hypothetical protein
MATWFRELTGSPKERFAEGGMAATRIFQCNWSERFAFVRDILGTGYGIGGTAGVNYPGTNRVRPTKVEMEPFTDDVEPQTLPTLEDGPNTYVSFAKVTVDYQTALDKLPGGGTIDLQERTWLTYRVGGSVEAVVIFGDNWKWNDGQRVNDPELLLLQRIPVVEHHLMWHYVLIPPKAAIDANVGKVNALEWHGFAPQTMLFDTWDAEKEFVLLEDGNELVTAWRLNYVFRERRIHIGNNVGGWNHFYRTKPRDQMGWDRLVDVNNNPAYELAIDFDVLFKYAEVE